MNPLYYGFTEEEAKFTQDGVDSIYIRFKTRVANGRNMPLDKVEEIAQGRIWIGSKAVELGLVDQVGSLRDAIAFAAQSVGVSDYKLSEYPDIKSGIEAFTEKLSGKKSMVNPIIEAGMKQESELLHRYYSLIKYVKQSKGVQMRMPYEINVN